MYVWHLIWSCFLLFFKHQQKCDINIRAPEVDSMLYCVIPLLNVNFKFSLKNFIKIIIFSPFLLEPPISHWFPFLNSSKLHPNNSIHWSTQGGNFLKPIKEYYPQHWLNKQRGLYLSTVQMLYLPILYRLLFY